VNKVVESTTLDEQESRLVLDLKSSEGNLFDSNPFVVDAQDILCRSLIMKVNQIIMALPMNIVGVRCQYFLAITMSFQIRRVLLRNPPHDSKPSPR